MEERPVKFLLTNSIQLKSSAFFRPTILTNRLRDLNTRMEGMKSEEIVEILTLEFFERLLKQFVYDENVILKTMKLVDKGYIIEDKQEQSTSQFSSRDKLEDAAENEEDRKSSTLTDFDLLKTQQI